MIEVHVIFILIHASTDSNDVERVICHDLRPTTYDLRPSTYDLLLHAAPRSNSGAVLLCALLCWCVFYSNILRSTYACVEYLHWGRLYLSLLCWCVVYSNVLSPVLCCVGVYFILMFSAPRTRTRVWCTVFALSLASATPSLGPSSAVLCCVGVCFILMFSAPRTRVWSTGAVQCSPSLSAVCSTILCVYVNIVCVWGVGAN